MIRLHFQPGNTDQENNSGSGAFRDVHLCPKEIGDYCGHPGPHEGCVFLGWIEQGRDMVTIIGGRTHTFSEFQFTSLDRGPTFPVRDAYTRTGGPVDNRGALQDAQGYATLVMEARKAGLRDDEPAVT